MEKTYSNTTYVITGATLPQTNDPMKIFSIESKYYTTQAGHPIHNKHKHANYELHCILDGEIIFSFDDENLVSCPKGHWIIISPNFLHCVHIVKVATVKISYQFDLGDDEHFNSVISNFTDSTLFIIGKLNSGMLDIINKQNYLAKEDEYIRAWMLRNNAINLILEAVNIHYSDINMRIPSELSPGKYDRIFNLALNFIKSNATHHISSADVSNFSYISQKQLNKIFHLYTGKNVSQCIVEHRLEQAKIELQISKNKSIHEISEKLDFCNEYYFCKFFKQHTGKTPRQYQLTANSSTIV